MSAYPWGEQRENVISALEHRGVFGMLAYDPQTLECWAESVSDSGNLLKSAPAKFDLMAQGSKVQANWNAVVDALLDAGKP